MKNLLMLLILTYRKQYAGTLDFPLPVLITPWQATRSSIRGASPPLQLSARGNSLAHPAP